MMMKFKGTFRVPTEEDIKFVEEHMRRADRRELKRWTAQEPGYELRKSVRLSEVCLSGVMPDGRVAVIFGACRANLMDRTAVLWSLSTDAADASPVEFCKGTREGVDLVMRSMPEVEEFRNFVDLEYAAAVRWIEWFGGSFSVAEPKRLGVRGGVFGMFFIINPYFKEG